MRVALNTIDKVGRKGTNGTLYLNEHVSCSWRAIIAKDNARIRAKIMTKINQAKLSSEACLVK